MHNITHQQYSELIIRDFISKKRREMLSPLVIKKKKTSSNEKHSL